MAHVLLKYLDKIRRLRLHFIRHCKYSSLEENKFQTHSALGKNFDKVVKPLRAHHSIASPTMSNGCWHLQRHTQTYGVGGLSAPGQQLNKKHDISQYDDKYDDVINF